MNLGAVIGFVMGLGILLTAAFLGSASTGGMASPEGEVVWGCC